eukprot:6178172-Pleurochrysis_carterae.AAC.5
MIQERNAEWSISRSRSSNGSCCLDELQCKRMPQDAGEATEDDATGAADGDAGNESNADSAVAAEARARGLQYSQKVPAGRAGASARRCWSRRRAAERLSDEVRTGSCRIGSRKRLGDLDV